VAENNKPYRRKRYITPNLEGYWGMRKVGQRGNLSATQKENNRIKDWVENCRNINSSPTGGGNVMAHSASLRCPADKGISTGHAPSSGNERYPPLSQDWKKGLKFETERATQFENDSPSTSQEGQTKNGTIRNSKVLLIVKKHCLMKRLRGTGVGGQKALLRPASRLWDGTHRCAKKDQETTSLFINSSHA